MEGKLALIKPNKSLWILPDGRVVDTEVHGQNKDGSAFSHGIFVKNWVKSNREFSPDKKMADMADCIHARAKAILKEHPELAHNEGGDNPFAGDMAWNQAAQEVGWIRVKPMSSARDNVVFFETLNGALPTNVRAIVEELKAEGKHVEVLFGGALENKAASAEMRVLLCSSNEDLRKIITPTAPL